MNSFFAFLNAVNKFYIGMEANQWKNVIFSQVLNHVQQPLLTFLPGEPVKYFQV